MLEHHRKTFFKKLKFIKNNLSSNGWERILDAISSRVPLWLFTYYHNHLIFAKELQLFVRKYSDYEIRRAVPDDASIMEIAGVAKSLFLHRLKRGDTCVIVIKHRQIVGWSWGAIGRLFTILGGSIVDMKDTGVFLYDIYINPKERMKGLISSCFKLQLEHYHTINREDIYGIINTNNILSLRTHLRLGFRLYGETFCVIFMGIHFCYYKSWPFHSRKWHVYVKCPPENLEWV